MTHNGKTSKFTKISSQDYTNILYSDSDSDNIPDLKLPPIKGKKPKRRKAFTEQQDTFCNFWMVVKLITGVLFFIVLVVLASVSFWSLRQISDLQDKIAALYMSDRSWD